MSVLLGCDWASQKASVEAQAQANYYGKDQACFQSQG